MAVRNLGGNLLVAGILVAGVYVYMNRDTLLASSDDAAQFAEQACVGAARSRFDLSNVRVYRVKKTNSGYLVGATVRLARGESAKIECLANANGGVEDITLEER